jgi:phage-related protein
MPGPQDVDIKPVVWIGTSQRDLRKLPGDVQEVFGYALYLAQTGKKHLSTKPLKGFGGASVLEVVEDYRGDTYRAVYTVKFVEAVYVLHVFQKKATHGIATPRQEIELIRERLKRAQEYHESWKR